MNEATLVDSKGQAMLPTIKRGSLIGLVGKARAGKDTIGNHLASRYGFVVGKFAAPVRAMITTLYMYAGDTPEETKAWMEDRKEEKHPIIGASFRELAQHLGTAWGRCAINEDLWANLAENAAEQILTAGHHVVFTDLRFPNEVAYIKAKGVFLLYVERPSLKAKGQGLQGEAAAHTSESHIEDIGSKCDEAILNDSDEFDLKRKVDRRYKNWMGAC